MSESVKRRDIGYTIISRLEETLRSLLTRKLLILFGDYKEGISSGIIKKTSDRAKKSDFETPLEFLEHTDFPDLKEISTYKGLYRYYFSSHLLAQDDFIQMMDALYKLRCKIAHVRGIFSSTDTDLLFENTREIANSMEDDGTDLLNFLDDLENNPQKYAIAVPESFTCGEGSFQTAQIPNNLPTPDYEFEGGFVGREDDIKKIINLVEGELHRVVTITGAGGVGKTALALRVIQRVLKISPTCFDGVIWLSAKENRLSVVGIEVIEPTLRNYEELLDTILEVMGYGTIDSSIEQKENDVNTIFELHNRLLIIVDNLETITDDRIIAFILDAHPKLKILITSRKGLGQVERRYELNQLKEKEAIMLFRQIALDKNLSSLSKLDNETIKTYVKKVACYPLAIKWVIGHVALGKDINTIADAVTKEESDIALFCFDHIYNSLNNKSKRVLCTLSLFDYPPQAGVLQYVTNLNQEEFEDSIQELVLVSLVIQEQTKTEGNEILTNFNLLSLTRGFVRNQLDHDTTLRREIEERMRTVQSTVEEAERAKKQYRFSLHNLGATTEEEKVAALLAQTAYQKYQGGRYADAVDDYKRASEIAPRFASVYRNWAVMESNEGHSIEADRLMQKAAELSPHDEQIWLTWGNMKRKDDKIKEALDFYLKAKEIAPNDHIILNALGQAKSRFGDYAEADQLFHSALDTESTATVTNSVKHEIINRTSIAENLKKWSEALANDRNYSEAMNKLSEAVEHCEKALELDSNDVKAKDLYRSLFINLGHVCKRDNLTEAIKYFRLAIVSNPSRFKEIRDTIWSTKEVIRLLLKNNEFEAASTLFTNKLSRLAYRNDPKSYKEIRSMLEHARREGALDGKIISINKHKGFCIIESTNSPGETYFGHVTSFSPKLIDIDSSYVNKVVTFFPEFNRYKDRREAKAIRISV